MKIAALATNTTDGNSMKIKFLISLILLAIVAALSFHSISSKKRTAFNFTCQATLIHHERHEDNPFVYKSFHTIVLHKDGMGYDQINGEASVNGKPHTLNRTILFNYYRKGNDNFLTLKVTGARVSGADDIPEDADKRYMSFTNINTERMVQLTFLPSKDMLISTALGPFFICAAK